MYPSVMLVLSKLVDSILHYPNLWAGLARAIILCATAFGFHLTADQIASLMLVVETGLTTFTHQQVTSNVKLNKENSSINAII